MQFMIRKNTGITIEYFFRVFSKNKIIGLISVYKNNVFKNHIGAL